MIHSPACSDLAGRPSLVRPGPAASTTSRRQEPFFPPPSRRAELSTSSTHIGSTSKLFKSTRLPVRSCAARPLVQVLCRARERLSSSSSYETDNPPAVVEDRRQAAEPGGVGDCASSSMSFDAEGLVGDEPGEPVRP